MATLDLSNNEIENEGAYYLATCLKFNTVVIHFWITNQHRKKRNISLFIKTLTNLKIHYNAIQTKGTRYLIATLRLKAKSQTLRTLDIEGNTIRKSIIEITNDLLQEKGV